MSRGPVVYSPPPGTVPQNPGDVIQSSVWNAFVEDVTLTFNTVQPIEYGGSNASTPIGAFDNFHTASTAIPSATTTDLSTASGYYVEITGTTTITGLGTEAAGVPRALRFSGILTLTHNATSLILPGSANITTAVGDTAIFVSEGGGNWRCIGYGRSNGEAIRAPSQPKGYLYGLTVTNNAVDATNDLDIAVGEASSTSASPTLIALTSALTKKLDATWAVGTNQGMNASGSALANGTYHIFAIKRTDTNVVDIAADTSVTGANIAANTNVAYTEIRRICSIRRDSGSIKGFVQVGDEFLWKDSVTDVNVAASSATATTTTLTVPSGIVVEARLTGRINSSGPVVGLWFSALSVNDQAPGVGGYNAETAGAVAATGPVYIRTNTTSQIRRRESAAGASISVFTEGYIDTRGRI